MDWQQKYLTALKPQPNETIQEYINRTNQAKQDAEEYATENDINPYTLTENDNIELD